MKTNNVFYVLGEKVIATYIQAFIGLLMVGTVINASVAQTAAIAAIPAALTVIANGVPMVPIGLPFYVDLAFRAIRTYVVAFLGFVAAVPVFTLDYSIAAAASTAAIPGALAVVKAGIARKVGSSETAALLPASKDIPALALARAA